jgi:hypothetical protein
MRYYLYYCIIFLFFTASAAARQKKIYTTIPSSVTEPVILDDHSLIIKDPAPNEPLRDIPDSLWMLNDIMKSFDNISAGNWLNKMYILIPDSLDSNTVLGLFPKKFIASYEIYWDGRLITRKGRVSIT